MTIADFILARLTEDDAIARRTGGDTWEEWALGSGDAEHMANWDPARALRENDAKRRIVEGHTRCDVHDRPGDECDACQCCGDGSLWPCDTLRAVASVYADHADYDPHWRP